LMGVVLAGGASRRMGINKLMYPVRGKPIVLRVVDTLHRVRRLCGVVVVSSARTASIFADLGVEVIVDNLLLGPISGLYIALRRFGRVFLVAGDMPFVTRRAVERLIDLCSEDYDACVPSWRCGHLEPLFSIYGSSALPLIEKLISRGMLSLHALLARVRTSKIPIEKLAKDPEKTFFNVNTIEDLQKLRKIAFVHDPQFDW